MGSKTLVYKNKVEENEKAVISILNKIYTLQNDLEKIFGNVAGNL